jgi:hypothetical protein
MKTHSMLLMAGLLLAGGSGAMAQYANEEAGRYFAYPDCSKIEKIEKVRKNYFWSLSSTNTGVVEGALAQIAYISLCMPSFCTEEMTAAVASLAATGNTPAIRYRAYLTGLVIENPRMFAVERDGRYESGEQLFSALATRLQATLLTYSDRKYVRPE